MIKLYGSAMSTCTRKVLMTIAEDEIPFEMQTIDFAKGEHKQPAHLARQPFGRIPAIDDDGFEMFESRAIARYLDGKAGGKLTPKDAKARAKMEQWMSIEASEFSANAMKYVYKYAFKREIDDAVLATAGAAIDRVCEVIDKELATHPYLVGNELTLADIGFMPYLEYTMASPAKEIYSKHPNFMKWWELISSRPSWQKVKAGKVTA